MSIWIQELQALSFPFCLIQSLTARVLQRLSTFVWEYFELKLDRLLPSSLLCAYKWCQAFASFIVSKWTDPSQSNCPRCIGWDSMFRAWSGTFGIQTVGNREEELCSLATLPKLYLVRENMIDRDLSNSNKICLWGLRYLINHML